MPSFAAFLGHQPHVSLAELSAVFPGLSPVRELPKNILLFSLSRTLSGADLVHLGGTMLLAEELSQAPATIETVPETFANLLLPIPGKVTFAIRGLGVPPSMLRMLLKRTKELLKAKGKPSRYVGNERHPAAAALLRDSGIVNGEHGCELVILTEEAQEGKEKGKKQSPFLWIGKTIAAHDPDCYTARDIGKPVRDTRAGLLPPKLAQVLLNLGSWLVQKTPRALPHASHSVPFVVYDPFCGSGVIPMEALLRRWTVLASDASLKAVNGCVRNLDWLREEHGIRKKDVRSDVWKHDATKPFAPPVPPDVIVTETALGPGLLRRPTRAQAQKLRAESDRLQIAFLRAAATSLPHVPIVCTWPAWFTAENPVLLERVWTAIEELRYRPLLPPGVAFSMPGRMSMLYRRPDQFVGREIILLSPSSR